MLKLTNLSDADSTLEKFGHSTAAIEELLDGTDLDGIELIRWNNTDEHIIPRQRVVGIHLPFWPSWVDFWRNDKASLLRQFGNEENIRGYYMAAGREEFIANYRAAFLEAAERGAQYVVFHIGHAELEDVYTYRYHYDDEAVINAAIELLNEILSGFSLPYHLLLENLWYPGLTFLKPQLAERLLTGVNYERTGFVLDIGHLINTNIDLKTAEEAVSYCLRAIENLGPLKAAIKTVHLNGDLSGDYVKAAIANPQYRAADDLSQRIFDAMHHVSKIDRHVPFTHPGVRALLAAADPDYLVYELVSRTKEELRTLIKKQNAALK